MTDTADLIERLADVWADDVGQDWQPNACILASRAAVETLAYFGITAEAVPVQVIWCNAEAWPLLNDHVPTTEWPEAAWSVGVGVGGTSGNGYNAHMMVHVPGVAWVDLTVGQFSRPNKQIVLPPTLMLEADDGTDDGRQPGLWRHTIVVPDVHLLWAELDDQSYKDAPDWRTKYRPVAARMIRQLRSTT